jgi:tetratricopeptide (TPR) repeat protein
MNNRWLRIGLFVCCLVMGFLWPTLAEKGLPGVEIRDPERYYHRLKALRMRRPDDAHYTYLIGNYYNSLQMQDEAIKEFRRCLKVDPGHIEAKRNLSRLLLDKGYPEEAFRHARDIMDKTPEDPEIFYFAGEILLKLEERELAREYFARVDELMRNRQAGPVPGPARK